MQKLNKNAFAAFSISLFGLVAVPMGARAADKVATDQYTLNAQLVSAARRGDESLARQTIDRGAALNTRNRGGNTALMLFTEKGNRPMVELLIERGADVNLPNLDKVTPLMAAADAGRLDLVGVLI